MTTLFFVWLLLVFSNIDAAPNSIPLEGYFTGYLSVCPGSTKEAKTSNKSLHYLSFLVIGNGNYFNASRTYYNYYKMPQLAQKMNLTRKTLLYMPGYLASANLLSGPLISSLYSKRGYNVLVLEYSKFNSMPYPMAVRFLRPLGKHVAEMLSILSKYGLNSTKLELLGISHGGQGIGFIAKNYKELAGQNISRLTSLDPPGPCFRKVAKEDRLDSSDADFVDVIHTNIDWYGIATPLGHVDFYINGGEYQINYINIAPCDSLCSHVRSFFIWFLAVKYPHSFIGIKCTTVQQVRVKECYDNYPKITNVLGLKTDRNKSGIFYVMTNLYIFILILWEKKD